MSIGRFVQEDGERNHGLARLTVKAVGTCAGIGGTSGLDDSLLAAGAAGIRSSSPGTILGGSISPRTGYVQSSFLSTQRAHTGTSLLHFRLALVQATHAILLGDSYEDIPTVSERVKNGAGWNATAVGADGGSGLGRVAGGRRTMRVYLLLGTEDEPAEMLRLRFPPAL